MFITLIIIMWLFISTLCREALLKVMSVIVSNPFKQMFICILLSSFIKKCKELDYSLFFFLFVSSKLIINYNEDILIYRIPTRVWSANHYRKLFDIDYLDVKCVLWVSLKYIMNNVWIKLDRSTHLIVKGWRAFTV